MISVALVVLVVFLFLRSARATVIPRVAVPLSLVATFGVMYLLGYSLDNLSLMALTISTGFVVDDAIVVTENVTRFIEEGVPPLEAALRGAKQIGFTIVSITVSLLAVFIPILLMGGIVGRLFREFAVTLGDRHRRLGGRLAHADADDVRAPAGAPDGRAAGAGSSAGSSAASMRVQNGYERGAALRARATASLVGVVTLGTVALTVALYVVVPKGLFPQQDTGAAQRLLRGAAGHLVPGDEGAAGGARARWSKRIPTSSTSSRSSAAAAAATAQHRHHVHRAQAAGASARPRADEVIDAAAPASWRSVEGIKLFLQAVQDVRIGGRLARTQYQYTLQDANLDELRAVGAAAAGGAAQAARAQGRRQRSADRRARARRSTSIATPRRASASRMRDIDDTLYDAFGQRQVATTYTQLNQYRVVLEVMPELGARTRRRSTRSTCARPRAGRCRCRRSCKLRERRGAAVDQPPGAVPVGDAVLQPRARRGARATRSRPSTAPSARSAAGRRSTPTSRARRRRSRTRWRRSRC